MGGNGLISLAFRSVAHRGSTAVLIAAAIALSITLFLGVDKIRQGARVGFESTISGVDLIAGARSGPINLLLYAVFRIGDATANMSWQSYEEIAARPEVAWAVPISLGDSHRGYRVMGTTTDYFERYRYRGGRELAFAQGAPFDDVFDVVLGADVARALNYGLGASIVVAHGLGEVSFAEHEDTPFNVVGVLERTGTPVDRTVHVSLEGIEAMHFGWSGGAAPRRGPSADELRAMPLEPEQITAMMIGLNSKIDALRLQRDINIYSQEALMAIIPGVALAQLWRVVGIAETALSVVAAFVVVVGLVCLLTNIMTSLNERRREMAVLRAVGARPWHIFGLLVSEAALLALIGAGAGVAIVLGAAQVIGPFVEQRYGLVIAGIGLTRNDFVMLGLVVLASALLACWPAWRAYRHALADGLTIQT